MASSNNKFLISLLLGTLLVGCSGIERQTEKAEKAAVDTFRDDDEHPPNTKAGLIQIYLPKDIKIEEEHKNNLILKSDEQAYLLFVNPKEKEDSSVLFLSEKEREDQYLVLHSFQSDDKFGFISIKELMNEKYELAVGIGGVKMTTETGKDQLKKEAEKMMEIVSSVPQE